MSANNHTEPSFYKSGYKELYVKAGTVITRTNGTAVSFKENTNVQMPTDMTLGEDYCIILNADGTLTAVADPFPAPATIPDGAMKVGGFHYSLTPAGVTVADGGFNTTTATELTSMVWTQEDVDAIAGINKHTIWDLSFRPKCDPRGMFCVNSGHPGGQFWVDIYFCGTQHIINSTSRYGTDVASGTVQPVIPIMFGGDGTAKYATLDWYEANEIVMSHGKRLLSYQEFCAAAFGVTENKSLGGSEVTIPNTTRQAGFTSKWGGEQMTGHHWTWGDSGRGNGGSAWVAGAKRGQTYGTPYGALFGSGRYHGASSGSRSSRWHYSCWNSYWIVGVRGACDHVQ